MKSYAIKLLLSICMVFSIWSCTSHFEDLNTNPYEVTNESLEQDFNNLGVFFPGMIRMLVNTTDFKYQIAQNLTSDSWVGYFATPTDFAGGANNTTYKMTWKDEAWIDTYGEIMAPGKQVIEMARENGEPEFEYWAKFLQLYGIQKVSTFHGPVIYSHYGESSTTATYDSEEELYKKIFLDLDEVVNVFTNSQDFLGFKNFDEAYKGDMVKWIKLANSLRLMLALRLTDVAPALAQQEAEKAANHVVGLMESNDDNFNISLGADRHPIYTIGYEYNDTRMSATMESYLVGLKDPRIGAYFAPVKDSDIATLVPDHPDIPFKGVKNGARIEAKEQRTSFSNVGEHFITATEYSMFSFAEVSLMLAEAKLRGWDVGPKTAQEYYEEGVTASFLQWGASGVDEYLGDAISKPIDYTDPRADSPDVNAFKAQSDITVKWNDGDSNERKLERIITQKWIASFPNSVPAWVDFRRTGYPKVEPVYRNDSGSSDGIIPNGDYIKRMRFIEREYQENEAAVQDAINKLGGPDEIGTRLWWDIAGPNF